jgi:hypothetical protein
LSEEVVGSYLLSEEVVGSYLLSEEVVSSYLLSEEVVVIVVIKTGDLGFLTKCVDEAKMQSFEFLGKVKDLPEQCSETTKTNNFYSKMRQTKQFPCRFKQQNILLAWLAN